LIFEKFRVVGDLKYEIFHFSLSNLISFQIHQV
jgi:hypothetical protein